MIFLSPVESGLRLTVHTQPKASRTAVVGQHGDALKIAIQSAPVEGAANRALEEFLAEIFGIAKRQICLESGRQSRRKIFHITGLSAGEAERVLTQLLSGRAH